MALSKNTKLFSLASFLVDISSEMLIPILPFILTSVLGAPIFAVGLMEAVKETIAKAMGIVSGIYTDKVGRRKKTVVFGYGLSALMKGALVLASTWQAIIAVIFLERIGKGVRDAPRDALIALSEKKENIGKAFGFRKMLDNFGAILGPLLLSVIFIFYSSVQLESIYENIFLVAFVISAVAVIFLFFVDEVRTKEQSSKKILAMMNENSKLKTFVISQSVFALGSFGISLFLLRAGDFLSFALIPIVYLAYNIFYTIFSVPAGVISDRVGPKLTLAIGYIFYLSSLAGFILYGSQSTVFVLFALLGLFMAINEVAPNVLIRRIVDKEIYGSAIGLSKGLVGWLTLPANLIAGALWTIYGVNVAFMFAIATGVMGLAALIVFVKD